MTQELIQRNPDEQSIQESSEQLSELELVGDRLGPQLRLFCNEFIIDFDHRRAAVSVNRAANAGVRILRNPDVALYIKLLTEELAFESLISKDMVQHEILHEFLPRARGEKDIVGVDRDGVQWKGKVTNMAAHGRAIDMMAKHSGYTVPEVVRGGLTININHKAMGIDIEGEVTVVDEFMEDSDGG